MRILFVCLGSTCRSPAAAHLARRMRPDWTVDHVGTAVRRSGAPVDPRMAALLSARGIDCADSRARQMTPGDVHGWDLVLGLEGRVVDCIEGQFPGTARLLNEAAGLGATDIADPYETGDYPTALAAIDAALAGLSRRYPPSGLSVPA